MSINVPLRLVKSKAVDIANVIIFFTSVPIKCKIQHDSRQKAKSKNIQGKEIVSKGNIFT